MTTALPLDKNMLHGISGPSAGPALLRASTFLEQLIKRGGSDPPGEFDDPQEADGWARRFYADWVMDLSPEEYSALEEYKKEGFRSLNRGLRDHDGDLSLLPPEDRLRAEGLDAALQKAPALERPLVVHRGRLPDAVLEAFEEGEEDTLLGQVFGDIAYTSTSLGSAIAREYGGSSRFPDSVGKITLPQGTRAGYVDAVLEKGQSELLLARESRIRIEKAYRGDGVYCIEGQLVPC
jgi:ADP-ribosyltransferase exoenzyme